MRRIRRVPLDIYINHQHVGTLHKSPSGALKFAYREEWLSRNGAGPISRSLPLSSPTWSGDRVEFVFENLLPDNRPIRDMIAAKKHAAGTDAFSLLSVIGRDCVGAVQFLPQGEKPADIGKVQSRPLTTSDVARILRNLEAAPLGMGDDDEDFRLSIAGAQEKTALLKVGTTWHVPHGTTPTTHIFKTPMPIRADGIDLSKSCENEHFCMTFLRRFGLPAARTELLSFEDQKALVVERFDRHVFPDHIIRRHQEDMCQTLSVPSSLKYQKDGGPGIKEIMRVLEGSDVPEADRSNFMQAQLAYWLLAASDGHAKNFSIFLSPNGGFKLTPLYDVMSIQPLIDAGQLQEKRMRLAMSIGKGKHYGVPEITARHFRETAETCNFSAVAMEDIFEHAVAMADLALKMTEGDMPTDFPVTLMASIANGVRSRVEALKSMLAS